MSSDELPADAEVTLPPPPNDFDETGAILDDDTEMLGAEADGEGTMDSISVGMLGTDAFRSAMHESQLDDTSLDSDTERATSATPMGDFDDDATQAGTFGASLPGSGPIEAELVTPRNRSDLETVKYDSGRIRLDGSESSDETMAMGDETMADMRKQAPRRLGDFELERKVGQGGMGEVWLARQVSLDRPVAVKVLPRSLATQENFIERFQREAKAAASLVHPNVIQIYAYGINEGTPYFAMEYVEGEDLQVKMRRTQLEWGETVDMMVGVGSALFAAHEKGLIHRDIKPSNIMLDKNGLVKVMDFGLAKATSGGPEAKSLTSAGLIMGTPNYLSPEQGRGDPLDGRSDLYSLGIVFYELITGSLPFRADTPAGLIFKHVYEPPPAPTDINPEIPPFLVEIVLKLLEKDPDDRYKSAKEFLADLAEFADNYSHYVSDAGERRPGSGYLDEDRLKGSGSFKASTKTKKRRTSDRRNAVTEEMTAGISQPDGATVPPPSTDRLDDRRRPSDRGRVPSDRGKVQDKPPAGRRPRPTSRKLPPPRPPKSSKAPTLFLMLLIAGAGGFFYAYRYHNEWLMKVGRDLGLVTPPPGDNGNNTPPNGGGIVPLDPNGGSQDGIAFVYTGTWPEGVGIKLVSTTGTIDLERGSEGRYAAGDYKLQFSRPGYEPNSWPVRLAAGSDGKGRLLDAEGEDATAVEPDWKAAPELLGAYSEGSEAMLNGDLAAASKALDAGARLDPEFRPDEGSPTISDLQTQLAELKRQSEDATTKQSGLLAVCQKHAEGKRWRTALQNLESLAEEERSPAWNAVLAQCKSKIEQGDTFLAITEKAILRGDFTEARSQLAELVDNDPEHPERKGIEKRLDDASALRAKAMDIGVNDTLSAAEARLETYLESFGTNDSDARRKLEEVRAQLEAAKKLAGQEQELREIAASKNWKHARTMAIELLKIDPNNEVGHEIRSQAEQAISQGAVLATVSQLDELLATRRYDALVRLLDLKSPSYAKERHALDDLLGIQGRFRASKHEHPSVKVIGNSAEVVAEWTFTLEMLGEPAHEYVAQHRIQLRRVDKQWLFTQLRVEGGVRVRR